MKRVENRAEWDDLLHAPLEGQARKIKPTQADVEQEGADFMNFMGTMTG